MQPDDLPSSPSLPTIRPAALSAHPNTGTAHTHESLSVTRHTGVVNSKDARLPRSMRSVCAFQV